MDYYVSVYKILICGLDLLEPLIVFLIFSIFLSDNFRKFSFNLRISLTLSANACVYEQPEFVNNSFCVDLFNSLWNFDFFSFSLDSLERIEGGESKMEKLTSFDVTGLSFLLLDLLDREI